jgi:thiosulfate/3-mercaptopyruvate sulfurtransferase
MTDASSMKRADFAVKPLVEAKEALLFGSALFLDVRPLDAFRAAHLTHAVRVPIESWEAAAKQERTSLDNTQFWEAEIGALGVDGSRTALIYDDGRLTDAARVWFILQHFGVPARVVNGGWPHLADLPRQSGDASAPAPAAFTAQTGTGKAGLTNRAEVLRELGWSQRILDARSAAEFSGQDPRNNARAGHLPDAIHLAHTRLVSSDGRLRSAAELRDIFLSAGFHPGDAVVTHCDGGGRAALAALALLQAGFGDVQTYYLSFADWAKDESCPIVKTHDRPALEPTASPEADHLSGA